MVASHVTLTSLPDQGRGSNPQPREVPLTQTGVRRSVRTRTTEPTGQGECLPTAPGWVQAAFRGDTQLWHRFARGLGRNLPCL